MSTRCLGGGAPSFCPRYAASAVLSTGKQRAGQASRIRLRFRSSSRRSTPSSGPPSSLSRRSVLARYERLAQGAPRSSQCDLSGASRPPPQFYAFHRYPFRPDCAPRWTASSACTPRSSVGSAPSTSTEEGRSTPHHCGCLRTTAANGIERRYLESQAHRRRSPRQPR